MTRGQYHRNEILSCLPVSNGMLQRCVSVPACVLVWWCAHARSFELLGVDFIVGVVVVLRGCFWTWLRGAARQLPMITQQSTRPRPLRWLRQLTNLLGQLLSNQCGANEKTDTSLRPFLVFHEAIVLCTSTVSCFVCCGWLRLLPLLAG